MKEHVARTERTIDAPIEAVWAALTSPERHSAMMFGAQVETDWGAGSAITWSGTWEGRAFTDHGEITAIEEPTRFAVTHFSPLSGEEDSPEHYHAVEWRLEPVGSRTRVTLVQDNNPSTEAAAHAEANWAASLDLLAGLVADD
ncbi:SRPBCC family protein [Amnibacterium sp.]|uniref:SRPBCC family protein n=1 Tax=Amnibacterium sp. TaxID=1872496 RepID=UPI002628076A|nr:SRPBCC family protein [Amnibacterium sp.]MCU1472273.1 ATPase [Amnibacterium sp.]